MEQLFDTTKDQSYYLHQLEKNFKQHIDSIFGVSVKAKRSFVKGEIIIVLKPEIVLSEPNLHTVQIAPDFHIYDKKFAGLITHSCNPNMFFDQLSLTFVAIQDIEVGDLLTQDYDITEDKLFQPFICKCGSLNCRGYIAGKNPIRTKHMQKTKI